MESIPWHYRPKGYIRPLLDRNRQTSIGPRAVVCGKALREFLLHHQHRILNNLSTFQQVKNYIC
jgi:hypothetical protein